MTARTGRRRRGATALLLTVAFSLGCRRAPPPEPTSSAADPPRDETIAGADAALAAADAGAASEGRDAGPATNPPIVGESCKRAPEDARETICVRGRIVGLYARLRTVEAGAGFDLLYSGEPKVARRNILRFDSHLDVVARGDVLVVHQKECGTCVAVLGWTFAGSLETLPDAALRALACRVLGTSGRGTDLRSARAWRLLLTMDSPDAAARSPECATVVMF